MPELPVTNAFRHSGLRMFAAFAVYFGTLVLAGLTIQLLLALDVIDQARWAAQLGLDPDGLATGWLVKTALVAMFAAPWSLAYFTCLLIALKRRLR